MATKKKLASDWDAVDAYFDYGLDVQNRRVFMIGDFTEDVVRNVVKSVYLLAGQSDEKIELYVSSFGGDEYEMLALYDVMNSIPNVIQTIAVGKCMSAAPLIIAAGSPGERYSMPGTSWMIHMGDTPIHDLRPEAVANVTRHNNKMTARWFDLMEQHTGTSAAIWKRLCKKVGDSYFTSDRALDLGLVDYIWGAER